jgi:hypothetical protein
LIIFYYSIIMSNNPNVVHLGVVWPKEIVDKIHARKGKYISRNQYLLKIIEEHLDDNEQQQLAQGERIGEK